MQIMSVFAIISMQHYLLCGRYAQAAPNSTCIIETKINKKLSNYNHTLDRHRPLPAWNI